MNQNTQERRKIEKPKTVQIHATQRGHTLVEVMVSISVLGFMIVALYAGFSSGFAVLRVARDSNPGGTDGSDSTD
jgi:prepilin-type N-terminal cleavage/methylation domain-containing protein